MVTVEFTGNLQRHVSVPTQTVAAGPVARVLNAVFDRHPSLRHYIVDDQGALRRHMAVFVNGETVRDRLTLSDPVPDGAEVHVIQALSGG